MSKLEWVKWEAGKFLGGVAGMSIEEIGVYSIVLNLIYDTGGPIPDDRMRIARRCGMRPTSFEKVLQQLITAGKLAVSKGLISNEKAAEVLETRSKVVEKWGKNLQAAKAKVGEIFNDIKDGSQPSAAAGAQGKSPVESESVDKKERKKKNPLSAKADGVYSQDFEELWKHYPRTKNTSKKDAWNIYRMLNEDRQAQVRAAVPAYAAAMRAEGRDETKIKHMTSWLNARMYETAAAPATSASNVIRLPWHKTATREQWERALGMYKATQNWLETWGPKPGWTDCAVPADLIDTLPYHLHPNPKKGSGNELLQGAVEQKPDVTSQSPLL